MGLQMTLEARYNHMATDFIDAYWKITTLTYDTDYAYFYLKAYPSRESSVLYQWGGIVSIQTVFPTGIPLDSNQQKSAVYNWIKAYTKLPFTDVFEEE